MLKKIMAIALCLSCVLFVASCGNTDSSSSSSTSEECMWTAETKEVKDEFDRVKFSFPYLFVKQVTEGNSAAFSDYTYSYFIKEGDAHGLIFVIHGKTGGIMTKKGLCKYLIDDEVYEFQMRSTAERITNWEHTPATSGLEISTFSYPQEYDRIYNALIDGKEITISIYGGDYRIKLSGVGFKDLVDSTFE